MKHIVIGLISAIGLSLAAPAIAQHRHDFHHRHHLNYHRHWHPVHGWVIPTIIGGAVVYAATRPETVVVQQPVIVQTPPAPVVNQPQTVVIDGVVYTKQIMIINGVQTEVLVKN